eukprot:Phypoly_transcript_26396.p1 GENE.Phypoly_transcript_26396~~Phypoly_transcript_26396.p1  ORF type:complete len:144 (+),score=10.55 Phypoly_transcript_26396:1-432(+)
MKKLLTTSTKLQVLKIEGFSSYYKSRRYRQWSADDELFSTLKKSPSEDEGDIVPSVSLLILKWCCISDDDVKNMCESLPNLKRVHMHICGGHSQEVITEVLDSYVDLLYDNDDGWQPGDDISKNEDAHIDREPWHKKKQPTYI